MGEKYVASPKYLIPIILSIVFTGILSFFIKIREITVEPITVFPETPSGATLNSSIFIILVAVTATFIYVLVKYGFHHIVMRIIKSTLILAIFVIFLWFGATVFPFSVVSDILDLNNIIIASGGTIILILMSYRGGLRLQILSLTFISSLTGTFLGVSIPLLTGFVLLAGLSVYDIISVFRGPIGKIAEKTDLEKFMGAVVTYKGLTIGMGDLVFYSMLTCSTMLNLGYLAFFSSIIGVLAGSYGTFKILEKREMFPGLPLSLGLGMVGALLVTGIPLL
ncbi:hypothetical protein [[Eubacterium] cellulosolvens]